MTSIYRNANDQAKVGNLPRPNKEDYHGGHLIADVFGGPGDKLNLIPMDKVLNGASGDWGQLEAEFRSILKSDPNARIEYNVELDYSGGGPQPGKIAIEYRINDGEVLRRSFENA
ncbi:DNA/RNA non-specific endonuclease [Nocardia arizonensis]|uniref:DNA/RNA non-specific endonuclease n=1 Tax=Nocardia arizonensis TaxID=1141647 RepID=UPI0009E7F123